MTDFAALAVLKRLMVTGSTATGFLMCEFSDMHEFVEDIMERTVFTHEMGDKVFAQAIREKAKPYFVDAIKQAVAAVKEDES